MVKKMNNQIKQRLYITLVAATLLWLLCMGVINIIQVQDIRSLALSECLKDNFNLFDLCYNKTNNDIYPTFLNYISPFIPVMILLWASWVFKLNFQIDFQLTSNKIRKILVGLVYFVAFLGFIFPFFIVLEKEVERLYRVLFYNLFLTPWLAICWISIPIFFQKLLDSEKRISEFNNLHRVVYVVAASPILAIISLLVRQELKI
ncbi:hypothetical protein MCEMAEM4_03250 [Burkholderiaceae bacterium]